LSSPDGATWRSEIADSVSEWGRDLANRCLVVCLLVGLLATLIILTKPPVLYQFLWNQEVKLQDQFFQWRQEFGQALQVPPLDSSQVVVIGIDDESAAHMKIEPPWPRQFYARLLRNLRNAGARAIAFDLIFNGPSPMDTDALEAFRKTPEKVLPRNLLVGWKRTVNEDDAAFADELRKSRNVVLSTNITVNTELFHGRSRLYFHTPYEPFIYALGGDSSCLGNVVIAPDEDGIVRRASLLFDDFLNMKIIYNSLGLRVVEKALKSVAVRMNHEEVAIAEHAMPIRFRINYLGPPGTITEIPFWKVLQWSEKANTSDAELSNIFKDKIVIIGYHTFTGEDAPSSPGRPRAMGFNNFVTPIGGSLASMSGTELQANIIANVISGNYVYEPEWWEQGLVMFLIALLFARLFSLLQGHPWSMLGSVITFSIVWFCGSFLVFCYLHSVLPVVVPIFGVAFPAWFLVLADQNFFMFRDRRRRTKVFQKLAAKPLAEEIDRTQLVELGLEGKRATVTTLVCQIHGLTSVTADYEPQQVIQMFNQCLSVMRTVVYEHNGIVDRMWNDGITALWGAPIPLSHSEQTHLAASCALQMKRRAAELVHEWISSAPEGSKVPVIQLQFGLNTGEAICGRIGSEDHTEYGAIGECVDLSIRLELLNRRYGTVCMVGAETAELITGNFEVRELDKISVEEDQSPQYIYELIGRTGKIPGIKEEVLDLYRQGRAAMEQSNYVLAEKFLRSAIRLDPTDKPSEIMLARCLSEQDPKSDKIPVSPPTTHQLASQPSIEDPLVDANA
jgi:adenylate cyclase